MKPAGYSQAPLLVGDVHLIRLESENPPFNACSLFGLRSLKIVTKGLWSVFTMAGLPLI